MKSLVFLAIGIVIAVIFMLMPAEIYEAVKYFDGGYSNELYNHGLYSSFALIIVGVTWVMNLIYYYLINSVKFDRWPHWLIMLIVSLVAAPAACVVCNESVFNEYGLMYLSESLQMIICHLLFTLAMFVIATFSVRWWSSNCRHSPF
ncbi:MAG: hypothetical protein ACI4AH_04875 [Muribaculaceae bacterium]